MKTEARIVEVAIAGVKGYLYPSDAERAAAYELLVELTTRPSSAQLASVDVTLTDELESVGQMFDLTREILRKHGTDSGKGSAGNLSLAVVALRVLNEVFRPVIDRWQPQLDDHFADRPRGVGQPTVQEWELRWARAPQCRAELNAMRASTRAYIETLAHIAGTPAIADAVLSAPSSVAVPLERIDASRYPAGSTVRPRARMVRWLDPVDGFRSWRSLRPAEKSIKRIDARPAVTAHDDRGRLAPAARFDAERGEEFWFDFAADMGDGFDGTAPVAWMMGRRSLQLPDRHAAEIPTPPASMPRAELVVFGGDEVYPFAGPGVYESHTELPFRMGLEGGPDLSNGDGSNGNGSTGDADSTGDDAGPTLVAIPGNHDWMGGIEHFEEVFVSGRRFADHWSTPQQNTWFHVALPQGWWIWGIDTGMHNELVGPQADYFREAARSLRAGDRVILVTPVPLWQLRAKFPKAYAELRGTFDPIIAGANATMPLCLSADTHVFAHLERVDVDAPEDHICAGGGGAFLQPTHNLPERIPVEGGNAEFRLTSRWPLSADSRSIAPGAGRVFSSQYRPLVVFIALLQCGIFGLDAIRRGNWRPDGPDDSVDGWRDVLAWTFPSPWVIGALVLIALIGVVIFRGNSVEPKLGGAARAYGLITGSALALSFAAVNAVRASVASDWNAGDWRYWVAFAVAGLIGGILGGALFIGLVRWSNRRIKANDTLAFSPANSTRFKHFLRFRIDRDGDLTCFVVGMDPVGEGWFEAMTPEPGTTSSVPPYDRAGSPRLHYVWGRTYEKFTPTPIDIALSVSDPEPTDERSAPRSLATAVERLSGELIDGGHTLLYGGLPDVGLTARLQEIDRERHADNPNAVPHLVNYVADCYWRADDPANDDPGLRRIRVTRPGRHTQDRTGDGTEDDTSRTIADLTAMRRAMTDDAGVRVVIGGPVRSGAPGSRSAPGILEEAYLALDAGVPLVVAGGFGGAAGLIAASLLGKPDRRTIESIAEHYLGADELAAIDGAGPSFVEMLGRFRSLGELRNGLTDGENTELLRSRDPETVTSLIRRSVHRVAGRA